MPPEAAHPQSQLFSSKFMSSAQRPSRSVGGPPIVSDDEDGSNDSEENDDTKKRQPYQQQQHYDNDDLSGPIVPTIMSPTPVPLPGPMLRISAGRSHSVAIAKDTKQVYCWGEFADFVVSAIDRLRGWKRMITLLISN
jgi:Regulator of chromosome condensation (RCC1) repeat